MEYLPVLLLVCSVAFISQTSAVAVLVDRTTLPRSAEVRQYLENSYPLYAHRLARRFDLQFQPSELYSADYADSMTVRKRNNAEVVHHILKNFGGIDRLSEVGK